MPSMHREGVVSAWIATEPPSGRPDIEVLKDLCGVEYYDIDQNEGYASDHGELVDVADLIRPLSYSSSFIDAVVESARELGIAQGRWSVLQYDFAYDPNLTIRPIAADPKFIGYFPYIPDPLPDWAR